MRLVEELTFPEGPRWRNGRLWFSDIVWGRSDDGRVLAVDEHGNLDVVLQRVPGGPPSGLGWLPDGRLLVVATAGRTLLAADADGTLTEYADLTGLASFQLNDMVVDTSGRAYVGSCDVPGLPNPASSELIIVHSDGRAEVADPAMRFPNGSVITPDGATLIVAETHGQCLTAFTVADDGTLADKRVWASVPGQFPDGICLDQAGGVWFADARGQACVRVTEGGRVTNRVETDQGCYACTLGGRDGRTLFVLTSVFRGRRESPRPGRIEAYAVDVPGTGPP